MNEKEFFALVNINAKKRYEYFIKKVADYEEVWGLYSDGWATTTDNNGSILIPFWPKKEFAEYCKKDIWENYYPEKIELNDFLNEWIPGMKKDSYKLSIFYNNVDSVVIEIDSFLEDLNVELENY